MKSPLGVKTVLAALMSMTVLAAPLVAQSANEPLPQAPPDHPTAPAALRPEPQQYLATARTQLEAVSDKPLNSDGRKKLERLRDDFKRLVEAFPPSRTNGAAGANVADESTWKHTFDDVERDLVSILGGGSSLETRSTTAVGTSGVTTASQPAAGTATPQAAGTNQTSSAAAPSTQDSQASAGGTGATSPPVVGVASGSGSTVVGVDNQGTTLGAVAVKEIGVKNLEPTIRTQLEQFRQSVELFFDATGTTEGHH